MALSPFMFVVAVLAAYRATVCVTEDSILDTPRLKYLTWCANGGAFKLKLADLAECAYCIGFWLSAVTYAVLVLVVGTWSTVPVMVHLVSMWAVAGGQAFLNHVDNALD